MLHLANGNVLDITHAQYLRASHVRVNADSQPVMITTGDALQTAPHKHIALKTTIIEIILDNKY